MSRIDISFNLTKVELKCVCAWIVLYAYVSFNLTKVELKCIFKERKYAYRKTFNLTKVELKLVGVHVNCVASNSF